MNALWIHKVRLLNGYTQSKNHPEISLFDQLKNCPTALIDCNEQWLIKHYGMDNDLYLYLYYFNAEFTELYTYPFFQRPPSLELLTVPKVRTAYHSVAPGPNVPIIYHIFHCEGQAITLKYNIYFISKLKQKM